MLSQLTKRIPKLKKPIYTLLKARRHYLPQNYIQLSGQLFEKVQTSGIFKDSMLFVDSTPLFSKQHIELAYLYDQHKSNFRLEKFIRQNFVLAKTKRFKQEKWDQLTAMPLKEHLDSIWPMLSRHPEEDQNPRSTLIHLPHPYIVPGGRFNCIYYWDSFFTALGLLRSGKDQTVIDICDNFVYLIHELGHIPNGNRVYLSTRSQPPFFALLLDLLATRTSVDFLKYLPALEKEHSYWTQNDHKLSKNQHACGKSICMPDGEILTRYFDPTGLPREESYLEDLSNTQGLNEYERTKYYYNIRSAAETGWDFSSRWMGDYEHLSTTRTTDIVPVDLNSLLYITEQKLADWNKLVGENKKAEYYSEKAESRAKAIKKYFYDSKTNFYHDLTWNNAHKTESLTLAGIYPLFAKIATQSQADKIATVILENFLKRGGVITTLIETGEQWDSPNGWAALQWLTIHALRNYNHADLANEIKKRWLKTNNDVYKKTGLMFEKYNVVNPLKLATGGEYHVQTGFGWTNGVALDLLSEDDSQ